MKYIFLDRDGVLNRDHVDYTTEWFKFEWLSGSVDALRLLYEHNYKILIITNQSGVFKGFFTLNEVHKLHKEINEVIGGYIEHFYICPHASSDNCPCRKPKPTMLFQAAVDYDLILSETYFIGDSATDIECGKNAGCKTILISGNTRGKGIELCQEKNIIPDYTTNSLLNAVNYIIGGIL